MRCKLCKQTYCEGTEGDVMIHDHTCEMVQDFNKEKQRREDAEKALEFYADKDSYTKTGHASRLRIIQKDDESQVPFSQMYYVYAGGKRAREHFEKYKGTK